MNAPQFDVAVAGLALWSSRLPSWTAARAVIRGEAAVLDAPVPRPQTALLPPTERRRIPDSVAIALEVAARACEGLTLDRAALPQVFASMHGDTPISDYMCSTLATAPSLISPTKFHNSVHNAAAGYWSIGVGSHAPYTSISAAQYTFGAGLLEAVLQSVSERTPVLFVAFDVEARGPLAPMSQCQHLLAIGVVIAPREHAASGRALQVQVEHEFDAGRVTQGRSAAAQALAGNALTGAFGLLEALAWEDAASVQLALSPTTALDIQVSASAKPLQ
jgi:hypothetical protein